MKITSDKAITLFSKSSLCKDFIRAMDLKCVDGVVDRKVVIGVINRATWDHNGVAKNVLATFCAAEGIRWSDVDVRSDSFIKEVRLIAMIYLREMYPGYTWERTYSSGNGREEVAAEALADAFA
jgi:hypothetical protein